MSKKTANEQNVVMDGVLDRTTDTNENGLVNVDDLKSALQSFTESGVFKKKRLQQISEVDVDANPSSLSLDFTTHELIEVDMELAVSTAVTFNISGLATGERVSLKIKKNAYQEVFTGISDQWYNIDNLKYITEADLTIMNFNGFYYSYSSSAEKYNDSFVVPSGGAILWFTAVIPAGWAVCDGTNGTPDMRGFTPVGFKTADAEFGTLLGTAGEKTHQLITSELASHGHTTNTTGNHTHYSDGAEIISRLHGSGGGSYASGNYGALVGLTYAGGHNHTVSPAGGNVAHNNIQPSISVNYIMKL
jgi:microcystin-dependent protein